MPYPVKGECRNTGRTLFKKGMIPWHKGKKCPQISLALKGRIGKKIPLELRKLSLLECKNCKKLKWFQTCKILRKKNNFCSLKCYADYRHNNPTVYHGFKKGHKLSLGKHHSKETKEKIGRKNAVNTKRKWDSGFFSLDNARKRMEKMWEEVKSGVRKDIFHPEGWKEKVSKRQIARYDLIGRKTYLKRPRHHLWIYKNFVKKVVERDNWICQICKKRGGYLEADHYPKSFSQIIKENGIKTMEEAVKCNELWDISNGRALCRECHRKTDTWGNKNSRIKKTK